MLGDDLAADAEAQTGPRDLARAQIVDFEKFFENFVVELFRDSTTPIAFCDIDNIFIVCDANLDTAFVVGTFRGVRKQIRHNL